MKTNLFLSIRRLLFKKLLFAAVALLTILETHSQVVVNTLAGSINGYLDANGINAQFSGPKGLCFDNGGNVYVAEWGGTGRIRHIDINGNVTTLATGMNNPNDVAIDPTGQHLYVAEWSGNRISHVDATTGIVTIIAGTGIGGFTDGAPNIAQFNLPSGITVGPGGDLFVTEFSNHCVRRISMSSPTTATNVSTVAGNGTPGCVNGIGGAARFFDPTGICFDPTGSTIYIADWGNHVIRSLDLSSGNVSTLAGTCGSSGNTNGTNATALFYRPHGVFADAAGNVFVAQQGDASGGNLIRKIDISTSIVSTYAGTGVYGFADGAASTSMFESPFRVSGSCAGKIYIADTDNHKIREITDQSVLPSFTGLNNSYCQSDPASTLNPTPMGGVFTGPGIIGNTFNPSMVPIGGPYNITYTYNDSYGCAHAASDSTIITSCNCDTILNIYTPITNIDSCLNKITVSNSSGFNVGDKVLLIQMKGATIDQTNTAAYGSITNINNCGNYEFATISNISTNVISLQYQLINAYSTANSDKLQLVSVPQFVNYTTACIVNPLPWNGTIGGVVVFEVSGALTLTSNIDASGFGFNGGSKSTNLSGAACATDYFYSNSPAVNGYKGEGIVETISGQETGLGALANGGGGGGWPNAGGAGGGSYNFGGHGGDAYNSTTGTTCALGTACPVGGIGGKNLSAWGGGKVFLGGGGGGGQQNDNIATDGANGGGIVIIKAGQIIGNGGNILAKGNNVTTDAGGDGAGGGGAGGAVLLETPVITGANITIDLNGGNGSNVTHTASHGPGGGGSGGGIFSSIILPGSVMPVTTGGQNGVVISGNCAWGAQPGMPGVVQTFSGIPESNIALPTPPYIINNDTAICAGNPILFSVSGGTSWLWSSFPAGLNNDSASFSYNPNFSMIVYCDIFNGACSYSDSVSIIVNPSPIAIATNNGPVCIGASLDLTSGGGNSYSWSGPGSYISNQQNPVINPVAISNAGIYNVLATDTNGCSNTAQTIVQVNANPTIIITGDSALCAGDQTILTANGGVNYLWNTGNNTTSIIITPLINTTYSVTGTDANNCSATASVNVIVSPVPVINISGDTLACIGSEITLTVTGGSGFLWQNGDTNQTITIEANENDTTISVIVFGGGCQVSDSITIHLLNNQNTLYIPNVFTPNSDGLNDEFKVGYTGIGEFQGYIFDRWGVELYSWNKPDGGWNGFHQNELVPDGVYVYLIKAKTSCGAEMEEAGMVTVFR